MSDAAWISLANIVIALIGLATLWLKQRKIAKDVQQVHVMVNSQRDRMLAEIEGLKQIIRSRPSVEE